MKAFITGATGFIGQNLVRTLQKRGDDVLCLARSNSDTTHLKKWGTNLLAGDLLRPEKIADKILECDIVFHLAGTTKALNSEGYRQGNVQTTENLLRILSRSRTAEPKLLYVSSQAAAGPSLSSGFSENDQPAPVSWYGRSKYEAEQLIVHHKKDVNYVILRPSIVFGPYDHEMLPLFRAASRGVIPHPGFGSFPVNFIFVADLINAILLAASDDRAAGKIYFVHDGQPSSWRAMNNTIKNTVNRKAILIPVALRALRLACLISGLNARIRRKAAYLNQDKWAEIKEQGWLCSADKIHTELGFTAHWTQAKAVSETAAWYKNNGLL